MINSLVTTSLTIIGGVIVYVLGRIIEKFIIEPIHSQKEVIGIIADQLIFFANLYLNPSSDYHDEKYRKASEEIRRLSSILNAKTFAVPCYKFLEKIKVVDPKKNILEASTNLIGLSNSFFLVPIERTQALQNDSRANRIRVLLRIPLN